MKLGAVCLTLALLCCIVEASHKTKATLDQQAQSDNEPHEGQDKTFLNHEKDALNEGVPYIEYSYAIDYCYVD